MVRRSSRPNPKELARRFPNIIEIEVPPLVGFGERLMILHRWLHLRGCAHAHWGRMDLTDRRKGPTDYSIWGFVHEEDAGAFRDFWAQIEHLDSRTLHHLGEQQNILPPTA